MKYFVFCICCLVFKCNFYSQNCEVIKPLIIETINYNVPIQNLDTVYKNPKGFTEMANLKFSDERTSYEYLREANKGEIKSNYSKNGIVNKNRILKPVINDNSHDVYEIVDDSLFNFQMNSRIIPVGIEFKNDSLFNDLRDFSDPIVILSVDNQFVVFKTLESQRRFIHYFNIGYNINNLFISKTYKEKLIKLNTKLLTYSNLKVNLKSLDTFFPEGLVIDKLEFINDKLIVDYNSEKQLILSGSNWSMTDFECDNQSNIINKPISKDKIHSTSDCPKTSACGCSEKNKADCYGPCCKWTVGEGCGCK